MLWWHRKQFYTWANLFQLCLCHGREHNRRHVQNLLRIVLPDLRCLVPIPGELQPQEMSLSKGVLLEVFVAFFFLNVFFFKVKFEVSAAVSAIESTWCLRKEGSSEGITLDLRGMNLTDDEAPFRVNQKNISGCILIAESNSKTCWLKKQMSTVSIYVISIDIYIIYTLHTCCFQLRPRPFSKSGSNGSGTVAQHWATLAFGRFSLEQTDVAGGVTPEALEALKKRL